MMKNLLLGLAAVAMVTNAMAVVPVQKGELKADEAVKQVMLKRADGRMQAVAPSQMSLRTPQKAPAAAASVVYSSDFENEQEWTIVDNSTTAAFPMQIGGLQGIDPVSGDLYLVSGYDSRAARNAWAFSEGVELTAGQTYSVGVYAYASGFQNTLDEWRVTVGTAANEASQTTTVIDRSGDNAVSYTEWTLCTAEFTPSASGTYYFGINHCTKTFDVNAVAFDLFQVDDEKIAVYPSGTMYSEGGLWSVWNLFAIDEQGTAPTPMLYSASSVHMTYNYVGKDVETVEWMFGDYASISTSTEQSPVITYNLTEDSINTDVYLFLRNADGEVGLERNYDVKNLYSSQVAADYVCNFQPEDVPTYYTNMSGNQYSFLFGMSAINQEFAEYFELPETFNSTVSGIMMVAVGYNATTTDLSDEVVVNICAPDAEGLPGEVLGGQTITIGDLFTGYTSLMITFDTPVNVEGSFFVTLRMPDATPSSSYYLALYNATERGNTYNTMYINIEDASLGIPTGWYATSELYEGMYTSALVSPLLQCETSGVAANKLDNSSIVYTNGKELNIVNAAAGSHVMVTDIAGRTVLATSVGNNVRTTINTNLNRGIYLVTVDGKTTKVAIR